jgi:hypothetical protein
VDSYQLAFRNFSPIPRFLIPSWMDETAMDSYYRWDATAYQPGDLMFPIYRYLDKKGGEQYRGNRWNNNYRRYRAVGWKGYSFLNDGDPDTPPQPQNGDPTYEPWEVDDYKWRDAIVMGRNGECLIKQWFVSDFKGKSPLPPPKIDSRQIFLINKAKQSTVIKGDLPLLTAEDNLIGAKLYRVDRSPLEPETFDKPTPTRSQIRKLPVETYNLSATTKRSIKTEKIYPVPQEAIILSASYCP